MRPVVVLGLPRGGTTWIARALASTPGTAYVHEPDGVNEPFAFRARFRHGLDPQVALAPGTHAPEYERLWRGALAGGVQSKSQQERIARWAFRGVSTDVQRRARETGRLPARLRLVMATATPLLARSDVGTVVVKSVNAALAAEWLWERFRPQVVVITRDLRNVVSSWLDIGFGPPSDRVYSAICREAKNRWAVELSASPHPVERTATMCAVLLLALHDSVRAHTDWNWIVHEDCSRDPEATFVRTANALGLTWSEPAREFVARSNRPGTGYTTNRLANEVANQWKSRLDAGQLDAIQRVFDAFPASLWQVAGRP